MTVSEKVREFAVYTSCHGIPHVATAKKLPIKLIWIAIVIAAAVLVVIDVNELYQKYKQHPKIVQSEIRFESIPFPADMLFFFFLKVTICNLNPIRKSQVHLVPQLEQLLSACDLPINKTKSTEPVDYCQTAKNSYRLMFPKGSQNSNNKRKKK